MCLTPRLDGRKIKARSGEPGFYLWLLQMLPNHRVKRRRGTHNGIGLS